MGTCHYCGKQGHKQSERRQKARDQRTQTVEHVDNKSETGSTTSKTSAASASTAQGPKSNPVQLLEVISESEPGEKWVFAIDVAGIESSSKWDYAVFDSGSAAH
eukprot:15440041-Alexandrium_andersonii.AAC.1